MDKNRDADRGDKNRGSNMQQRLDIASAMDALYAPWLQQEHNLLSNMFGSAGHHAYSAAAAAAAMSNLGALQGLPPGYSPVSSSAGLVSLAAAQQAQQAQAQAQAAALASLGPSAAWWNLAGLQQMEFLSRLQGGLGGYPGLHPEHLMNLELLQAQQAAAMAAALSSNKAAAPVSRTSSNGSTSSSGSSSLKSSARIGSGGSNLNSNPPGGGACRSSHSRREHHSRPSLSRAEIENHRIGSRASSSHHGMSGLESSISVRSDLGSTASGTLSYGIASLMADKLPSSHKTTSSGNSNRSTSNAAEYGSRHHRLSNNEGPPFLSKAIRTKELEIIPISPSSGAANATKDSATTAATLAAQLGARGLLHPPSSTASNFGHNLSSEASKGSLLHSSDKSFHRTLDSIKPPPLPNFSGHRPDSKTSISNLTNGVPSGGLGGNLNWREEGASVSIEPCSSTSGIADDAPLNLSLKTSSKAERTEKRDGKEPGAPTPPSHTDLLSRLKPPINPFDYTQSLGLGMGLIPDMAPSLEVLQSFYGHHGESRDVLASMHEALQRQLLVADSKKRDEKKKRMEDAQERARHLGRGISKPKKNTVASLLEHCRAAGIKPQIPFPTSSGGHGNTSGTTSPTLFTCATSSIPLTSNAVTQSLPPSLIPIFPASSSQTTSTASIIPPIPSVSISPFPASPPLSSTLPLSLPPSLSISTCSPSISLTSTPSDTPQMSPSVTVQPALLASRVLNKEATLENRVQITPISCQETSVIELKKRHSVDGRQLASSKASSVHSELSELSDSDEDEDSSSVSSMDDESTGSFPSPWMKRDASEMSSGYSDSLPTKKRKMITDEGSLRVPLLFGWRRETTMRGVTQSGVRGEVIYYAPCGKPFKQYPDIIRYLERQNINEVTRDHFSFSSKITVGEYVDANTQQRYTEQEIRDIVKEIRIKKGLKAQKHANREARKGTPPLTTSAKLAALQAKENRDTLELEAEAVLRRLEAEEKAEKSRLVLKIDEQRNVRAWKEQEKMKKQEELRREKEEQKKQKEEVNRQRLYEQLKKAQEREQEKQKQKLLKEQFYLLELTKQREMLYTLELERERRRYHGVLVRSLEARKRYEEREKRREFIKEEKRVFKEKKKEERMAARELNLLLKESKEDMELTDHQPLPRIPHLAGIKLDPETFGNVLMIFEFLHNFGETLGFDMDSLPSLHSLQLALLHDSESEEELLNVLTHLLVCAIEDPGIPNPQRHTNILGQTLNRADITPSNISEILRVYLYANATGEVRTVFNVQGTEKEKKENPTKSVEFDVRMEENETYRMSVWLQKVPFLALNAVQKSDIVCYVCNELLQSKAVIKQIEDSLDKHNGLKTEKWKLDARIRKLRMRMARKRIYNTAMRNMMVDNHRDDSNLSSISGMSSSMWDVEKKNKDEEEVEKMKDDDLLDDEEDHDNESGNDSDAMEEVPPDEEEDKTMNADEASKTLEHLQQEMEQVRQQLFETAQQVRGFVGGQDRYQRTFWVLPHTGGPFLEGLNTCDYIGRSHFPLELPPAAPKEGLTEEELKEILAHQNDGEENAKETKEVIRKVEIRKKEDLQCDDKVKKELKSDDKSMIKKESSAIERSVEETIELKESKKEKIINGDGFEDEHCNDDDDKIAKTKNSDGFKHGETKATTCKEEIIENDSSTIGSAPTKAEIAAKDGSGTMTSSGFRKESSSHVATPSAPTTPTSTLSDAVDKDLVATGLGLIPGQYLRPEHVAQYEKLVFSLLPHRACDPQSLTSLPSQNTPIGTPKIGGSCSGGDSDSPLPSSPFVNSNGSTPLTSLTPILQNSLVSNNLSHKQLLEKLHQSAEALPVPDEFKNGWWHVTDLELLKRLTQCLNERGAREREMKRFLERNFNIVKNSLAKVDADAINMEAGDADDECTVVVYDKFGMPVPDEAWHWSPEVALKVDKIAVEAIYAIAEKVTSASMQNKNWRIGDSNDYQNDFTLSMLDPTTINDGRRNPVHVGRGLLLSLEDGIERRYLKPPLGILPTPKGEGSVENKLNEQPKGLATWREAVFNCETAAQLAMCTYQLETAIAWDRSIMKAYCQFCHSGDFEEKLLLCDGCDKGYHTHCFKPPMVTIPEGDWYCYECINKFSGSSQRHCLVCGGVEGRNLIYCSSCDRAYHTNCIVPPMNKIPRNKWNCPSCSSKNCRGRRGRNKKLSESSSTPSTPSSTSTPTHSTPQTANSGGNSQLEPSSHTHNAVGAPMATPPVINQNSTSSPDKMEDEPPSDMSAPELEGSPLKPPTLEQNAMSTANLNANCTPVPAANGGATIINNNNKSQNSHNSQNVSTISTPKKERGLKKKDFGELATCKIIQGDLESHADAWPFLFPVNTRQFPTYKKIIKKPIDLSTIRKKLDEIVYKTKEDYSEDLRLMFNNCERFNEDESPVGKAGHSLRSFFEAKWNENFVVST